MTRTRRKAGPGVVGDGAAAGWPTIPAATEAVRRRGVAPVLVLAGLAGPALAEDEPPAAPDLGTSAAPDHLDDRSDPAALIRSLYNAIDRHEYVRAYSDFRDEPDRPGYADFAAGFRDTRRVRVRTGKAGSDGAAGSLSFTLPAAVEAVSAKGTALFAGCYTLRLVQPGVQAEPPFRPMGIVKGRLAPATGAFASAMGTCPKRLFEKSGGSACGCFSRLASSPRGEPRVSPVLRTLADAAGRRLAFGSSPDTKISSQSSAVDLSNSL